MAKMNKLYQALDTHTQLVTDTSFSDILINLHSCQVLEDKINTTLFTVNMKLQPVTT